MEGFYPSRSGGSIRGTSVFLGNYGLQVIEGGRIGDTHFDVARSAIRRALKNEKERYS
jgi:ribosomal protein L16/L10AE